MPIRPDAKTHLVLARSFAVFKALAQNSPGPTQTAMATQLAGECLWALGIEEHGGFHARHPEVETIDIKPMIRKIGSADADQA